LSGDSAFLLDRLRISLIVITHSGMVIRCSGYRDHGVGAERGWTVAFVPDGLLSMCSGLLLS
jgi:hypothetical protein